ncbi:SRPBCC domain-containing protein [Aquimarina sp. AU58]|uniref:SRPBCC family protein n=1 Tax=Aquimarina sp. AU58 TaxID=1874112 RepID=UPI000D6E80FE|nr:SRPBCC domain-containing protein [Aquimarina sp. AU58]
MKRKIEFLSLVLLTFLACNYKANKLSTQQYHENKMKELIIERQFDIEPEKVYRAFTNPKDMIVWWTPDTEFDIDLRVGGQYTITREENGTKFVMTGKYLEVEQPYRLKYTCGMLDFSPVMDTITVEIRANENGGSQLRFIQVGKGIHEEIKQLPEGTISETEKGWNYGFDLMEKSWKENKW